MVAAVCDDVVTIERSIPYKQTEPHRVYVMLDDDLPSAINLPHSELATAQEWVRGLEEQVTLLQEQLDLEQQHNAELVSQLKAARIAAAKEQRGPWWRFW